MSRVLASVAILLFAALPEDAPASTRFYVGPTVQYLHCSHDKMGDLANAGLYGGVIIVDENWGKLGIEADCARAIGDGAEDFPGEDWSLSWATASISYRTPERLFVKTNFGYSIVWFHHEPEWTYSSGSSTGTVSGFSIGYGIGSRSEILINLGVVGEFFDEYGAHDSYAYRIGAGYGLRF